MFVVTSNQMYQAECSAVKRGTTFPKLMEDAGSACADIIRKNYCIGRQTPAKVLVICGKGKNGGDGFVIARRLWEYGCLVTVMLVCGEPQAKDAIDNFLLLESAGIDVIRYNDDLPLHRELINSSDIIVDAVFGTGFSGRLDPDLSRLAKAVNSSGAKKAAVDVPSGANCDSASIEGAVFKADLTIAISAYKPIHIMKPCCAVCGKTVIADIGIEDEDFKALDSVACLTYDARDIKRMLPKRKPVSNKGTCGHALCVCGSMRMTGAACLAVGGALRCGAGLVTAAFPQSAYAGIAPKLTEPLLLPLDSNFEGTFSFNALADIFEASKRASAVLLGCGIGFNKDTTRLTLNLIKEIKKPVIIDADGINALSTNIDILREAQAPVILTPHPGEMSRLCGKSIAEIVANPIAAAYEFSREYGVTVVLKGANTIVCGCDPTRIYVNPTGNAGLARGGSGDLLAGMTVSLLAQGMKPFEAAVCAVYLHGLCADAVAQKTSMRGMLPSDVLNYLPEFFSKFE